jgi:hypothetical protein
MIETLFNIDTPGIIYDLRRDKAKLNRIRKASLSTGQLGLTIENGIVGSPEWWSVIESGRIKVEKFIGFIRDLDRGPMGDSAIVRIEGNNETKGWIAWEEFNSNLIGKKVDIRYVDVPPKHPPKPGFTVDLLLQVRVIEGKQ